MDAYAVLLQACCYGKTAFPNKRTRPITFQRRYQTKERVQLLSNGVTKQKNASNYFLTALPKKRTRPITLQRAVIIKILDKSDSHHLPTDFTVHITISTL